MKAVVRHLYEVDVLGPGYAGRNKGMKRTDSEEKAVLRSSEVKRSLTLFQRTLIFSDDGPHFHAPALDIDGIHCELKPSSTKGNFHLYIDKPMSWSHYVKLLAVLREVGIIDDDFYNCSIQDKKTMLRIRDKKHDPK